MTKNNIEMTTTFNIKKQEEPQMTKENKIENILKEAEKQINELREMIRSMNIGIDTNFDNYLEQQEEYLKIEKKKRRFLKLKMNILQDALEVIEKEIDGDIMDAIDLSTDTKMKLILANNRLDDIRAKTTNNLIKIKTTENIIEEERRKAV